MKRLPKSEAKEHGKIGSEIVIEYSHPAVFTTMQRRPGYATADTHAYIISGEYANGDFKLKKHPNFKSTKGYRAYGG